MNILKATKRTISSGAAISKLRSGGQIPAILYGGKENNISISLKKLSLQELIKTETFMSKVVNLEIDGNAEKALPKDIAYDPVSDEPIHIDFMRIIKGSKLILEIPVKFVNAEKSPGLKKGGVLNIVRRKVKLKCPAENIPDEIIVDLDNTEINTSFKISSVKLPENVTPTITDRDFVIATVVAPTVLVEPEKTEEATADGEVTTEGAESTEGAATGEEDKTAKASDDKTKASTAEKGKSTKPSDASAGDKGKPATKKK
jgi:large subunit ribosomal protein L25